MPAAIKIALIMANREMCTIALLKNIVAARRLFDLDQSGTNNLRQGSEVREK